MCNLLSCSSLFDLAVSKIVNKIISLTVFSDKLLDSMPENAIRQLAAQFLEQNRALSAGSGLPNGGIALKDPSPLLTLPSQFAIPQPPIPSTPHKGTLHSLSLIILQISTENVGII